VTPHQTLVQMYKELLLFYLEAVSALQKWSLKGAVQQLGLDDAYKPHVDNFNEKAAILQSLVAAETFATTQNIRTEQIKAKGGLPFSCQDWSS
jgi:hypothetical protein